jgi:hypothetical protein
VIMDEISYRPPVVGDVKAAAHCQMLGEPRKGDLVVTPACLELLDPSIVKVPRSGESLVQERTLLPLVDLG